MNEIWEQFIEKTEWVFFSIRVPKDNLVSTLAVELIFSQLHALHVGHTLAEKYIEGKYQLWYSLEMISMGGKVSFVIRAPKKMKNVVESAVYSQYPNAEITEIEDYMKNFHYHPEESKDIDIWGTEWKIFEHYTIPIKTYKDFEHPAAEETVVDPLSAVYESLSKIEPYEFFGIQIIIQPVKDEDWKPKGEKKVKELTGEEPEHEPSFIDFFLKPFSWLASFSYKKAILPSEHTGHEEGNKPKNNWLNMTEFQKERVNLIERKISKQGYNTKIRFLYIAPKDKFDVTKKSMFNGAFRPFGSVMTNKIKPDVAHTWTAARYKFSPTLERPILNYTLNRKKHHLFEGYKKRSIWIGLDPFVLNVEELATLYHFPITSTAPVSASIEKTVSKKVQPPVDLPIA